MSAPSSPQVRTCHVVLLFIRLVLIVGSVHALLLASPSAVSAISDEEVRLIREIEEIRYTIEHTEWTWANRDEKKSLEDQLVLLNRILSRVDQRKVASFPKAKGAPAPRHRREVSNEEVQLIREIEELNEKIAKTEWTWENRDSKTELEKRVRFLEQTLEKISP